VSGELAGNEEGLAWIPSEPFADPVRPRRACRATLGLGLLLAGAAAGTPALGAAPPPGDAGWAPVDAIVSRAGERTSLGRIQDAGVLRWGVDPAGGAPFAMPDPRDPGRLTGFEIELVERLCQYLGVRSEPVPADWLALIDNLKAGRTDLVLNGLEVSAERAEAVDFTAPYYRYGQQLTIRAADRAALHSLEDLRGRRISVLNGSASVEVLRRAGWPEEQIVQYDDSLAPYVELRNGRVDGSLAESIIAGYYAASMPELYSLPQLFAPGEYAGAVRKGEPELLAALDAALGRMKVSGDLGRIYQRWGIWSDAQRELGIVRGPEVAKLELASPKSATHLGWGRILRELSVATGITVLLTAISMPLAVLFGLGLALLERSPRAWLEWPARAYIQGVRGTPLLVQIFLVYYTLPVLGRAIGLGDALVWPAFGVGILCLAGNYAAYEAEIHRAGLEAVPKGQREAALSLGMTPGQSLRLVELPQSFRIILPPVINDLVAMIKDTSLVYVIGVRELTAAALGLGKARLMVPQMLVLAAAFYLVVSLVADALGKRVEARLRSGGTPRAQLDPNRLY
jgi:polar amino acid transport system permease protein/polar amino acid transport system substrate-binding protein